MRSILQSFLKLIVFISITLIILVESAKWIVGPIVIPMIVYKNMELTNGTLGYDTWECNAQYKYINITGVIENLKRLWQIVLVILIVGTSA